MIIVSNITNMMEIWIILILAIYYNTLWLMKIKILIYAHQIDLKKDNITISDELHLMESKT